MKEKCRICKKLVTGGDKQEYNAEIYHYHCYLNNYDKIVGEKEDEML